MPSRFSIPGDEPGVEGRLAKSSVSRFDRWSGASSSLLIAGNFRPLFCFIAF